MSPLTVLGALLLFPLVILAGVSVLHWSHLAQGYLFPLMQLLAVILPAVVALGLVERAGRTPALRLPGRNSGGLAGRDSRRDPHGEPLRQAVLGPPSWRRLMGALGWGLTGGALIAMILEIGAVVALIAVVALFLGATGQSGQLDQWLTACKTPARWAITRVRRVAGSTQ